MEVYRIEHKVTKRGPYNTEWEKVAKDYFDAKPIDKHDFSDLLYITNSPATTPAWGIDFKNHEKNHGVYITEYWNDHQNTLAAFPNLEELSNWFNEEQAVAMSYLDFEVIKYEVEDAVISDSGKQCVFFKSGAKVLAVMNILDVYRA